MKIIELIKANGGEVVREEWRLSLRRGKLSDDALAWVKSNMQQVRREVWPEYDEWEERAAIREYDGGQSRQDAEHDAYKELAHA